MYILYKKKLKKTKKPAFIYTQVNRRSLFSVLARAVFPNLDIFISNE